MIDPSAYRDLISGRRRGPMATILRPLLHIVECFYTFAVRRRNRRYDTNPAAVHRAAIPVISVGNITLGGTGKTPMVEWLARQFTNRGLRPAIVSRGYGAKSNEANDEAMELRLTLPNVPHVQNPDRVAAAKQVVETAGAQVIVLDDAFQHRRIARDLDIVLLDALEPFGFGHVFPRGTLREPLDGLARADAVVLSRANLVATSARAEIWRTVRRYAPRAVQAEAIHAPRSLIAPDGRETALDSLAGQRLAAFCGIGNPAGFQLTLENSGLSPVGFKTFPDHHRFTPSDLESLAAWARELNASTLLCTRKDLVKLSSIERLGLPVRALAVELQFISGQDAVDALLTQIVTKQER